MVEGEISDVEAVTVEAAMAIVGGEAGAVIGGTGGAKNMTMKGEEASIKDTAVDMVETVVGGTKMDMEEVAVAIITNTRIERENSNVS